MPIRQSKQSLNQRNLSPTPTYEEAAAYALDTKLLDEASALRDKVGTQIARLENLDSTPADSDDEIDRVCISAEDTIFVPLQEDSRLQALR